jgi:hypothetical protein
MTLATLRLRRRHVLAAGLALPCSLAAAPRRTSGAPVVIGQLFDAGLAEQDVARDFLVGARAAWQDINSLGGLRGRPVQHLALEVDGSPESTRAALRNVAARPDCIALSGTVSDPLAVQATGLLRELAPGLAHVAPWLQNSALEVDERTFPIFAGRHEQIAHAIRSLSTLGVQEVGAVYASSREHDLYAPQVAASASALKVKLSAWRGDGDLGRLGQRLGPGSPALLLFLGGTPELVQFTQGLQRQARQRYVIALGEINLQTLLQMGAARTTPVIASQPVPMVRAALPVVRRYREALARFFDEPPVALSLAGFIAARYTFEVLQDEDVPLTRAGALAAFQRRADMDLGGFQIRYGAQRRSDSFVTQSMLTADGRVVG